ncbi:MAG: hypothetical protein Ct9H300mP9_7580 [Candidatus Neomarinimicrobiota bacterium]|nr:MAG: hypothetical protein Ct9H300mP9_7580 [Candidatus Neomarinimicrobiota bacterium]
MMISCLLFGQVDYSTQIQTIFNSNCGNCHLGNSSGGLNLSNYDNVMAGGDNGDVIEPGEHADSYLWQRVDDGTMPPGTNPDLSADEIDLIAQWIDEGGIAGACYHHCNLFTSSTCLILKQMMPVR